MAVVFLVLGIMNIRFTADMIAMQGEQRKRKLAYLLAKDVEQEVKYTVNIGKGLVAIAIIILICYLIPAFVGDGASQFKKEIKNGEITRAWLDNEPFDDIELSINDSILEGLMYIKKASQYDTAQVEIAKFNVGLGKEVVDYGRIFIKFKEGRKYELFYYNDIFEIKFKKNIYRTHLPMLYEEIKNKKVIK